MQEANFSNTSIISQKSLNTSTPNMNAHHKLIDNKEFSIMLPKANKKPLLDSIATLKSSYITFHSKLLQRSQSYEELSNSSHLQEPKKEKNQSNGNINENQMIAETRSLNERSTQPNPQRTSKEVLEGQKEEKESVIKEERKSGGKLVEKEVSVLIQNSGLIKREISMINQDETLKNFIDELEFSQKEGSSHNDDNAEPSHHHEEDPKPKIVESIKSNKKTSSLKSSAAKENSREISKESVKSVQEKEGERQEKPFWRRMNKLSIVINVLLISMFFMAQKVEVLFASSESNQKEPLEEIVLQEKPLMEIKNETVVTVEVIKDVREYREYQEMKVQKEKLEEESRDLKLKAESLEKEMAELSESFNALNTAYTKTLERISSVRERLEQGKENMDKVKDNNVAAICSRYLGVIGAQLFGKGIP